MGAGGRSVVETCARLYESIAAAIDRREPLALMHTALVVTTESGRKVIECAWPAPDEDASARGVQTVGPVFARFLRRFRVFRYEVRCWDDGNIPDLECAVASTRISEHLNEARRVVAAVSSVPAHRWGRDELGTGEMWNSNSVISYVLVSAGVPIADVEPPPGGRAPGWTSGMAAARSPAGWDQRPLSSRQ